MSCVHLDLAQLRLAFIQIHIVEQVITTTVGSHSLHSVGSTYEVGGRDADQNWIYSYCHASTFTFPNMIYYICHEQNKKPLLLLGHLTSYTCI